MFIFTFLWGVAINDGKSNDIESSNEGGTGGRSGEGVTYLQLCSTIMAILVNACLTLLRTVRHCLTLLCPPT